MHQSLFKPLRRAKRLNPLSLLRWVKARALRIRLYELQHQLSTLRQHMAIDQQLAAMTTRIQLDRVLVSRMHADSLLERQLTTQVEALQTAIARLEQRA
jgi:hypothetical protein